MLLIKLIKKIIIIITKIVLQNKLLSLILIIAAILRFVGTNPGYNPYHADEGISYSAASSMIKNGNLDPLRYDYPALVPLVNYLFFKFLFIPIRWTQYYLTHITDIIDGVVHIPIAPLEAKKIFQVYILGERERNALFWGRYVTALVSLLNVFLTYLLAKRLFNKQSLPADTGKNIGLIAAFLLTFNFKHVQNSHIGLPDIYNAFFLLVALLTMNRLWLKPTLKNYLISGIAVGLSFSVKYQIFAIFPLILVHFSNAVKDYKINYKKLLSPFLFLVFLMIPVMFALINPYFLLHFEKAIKTIQGVSIKYGMGTNRLNLYPFSYFYHIDYGFVEFFAIPIGLLISLKKFRRQTFLLLSFLAPYLFVLLYYSSGGFYVRNFITVTPFFLMFASTAIWFLYINFFKKLNGLFARLLLIALLVVSVFIPGKNAIINSYYYTKPWGYDIMRPWIQQNLPSDIIIASHPFDAANLHIKNKRTEFEIAGAYSLAEHKENGASFALLDLNWAGIPFYFWMSYGFDDLHLYWDKPVDIMRSMFHGIATEEFFRYQIHAVTKPWQAPDTHLLVIKFPDWPKVDMSDKVSFHFNEDLNGWKIYGRMNQSDFPYQFDPKIGRSSKGSLVFFPFGAKFPITRITSPLIDVEEGHLYEIEGFLKTEKELETREREGFLRVDFYGQNPDLEKVGMIASVSSRVYGTSDWVKKSLIERAPKGSKYLTVSFQMYVTTRTKIWLDDVTIKQSKEVVEDITAKPPYKIRDIDLNYVYPNSHGNL